MEVIAWCQGSLCAHAWKYAAKGSVWVVLAAFGSQTVVAQVRLRTDEAQDARAAALREEVLGQDREIFQLDCRNDYFRRDVSLFANGTIRVREGYVQTPEMWLGELDLGSTSALIAQLQIPDLSEVAPASRTVVGDWVETCTYILDLPGEDRQVFEFRRLDILSLPLQKSLSVAIATLGMVDRSVPSDTRGALSSDYFPKRGDILVTPDGREFRVSGFANSKSVVELVGVRQPIVRFIAISDLPRHFMSLKEDR